MGTVERSGYISNGDLRGVLRDELRGRRPELFYGLFLGGTSGLFTSFALGLGGGLFMRFKHEREIENIRGASKHGTIYNQAQNDLFKNSTELQDRVHHLEQTDHKNGLLGLIPLLAIPLGLAIGYAYYRYALSKYHAHNIAIRTLLDRVPDETDAKLPNDLLVEFKDRLRSHLNHASFSQLKELYEFDGTAFSQMLRNGLLSPTQAAIWNILVGLNEYSLQDLNRVLSQDFVTHDLQEIPELLQTIVSYLSDDQFHAIRAWIKNQIFAKVEDNLNLMEMGVAHLNEIQLTHIINMMRFGSTFEVAIESLPLFVASEEENDFILVVDGQEIATNRQVLRAHETFFDTMLGEGFIEAESDRVELHDVEHPNALIAILRFFHGAPLRIEGQLDELLQTASYFSFEFILHQCDLYLFENFADLDNPLRIARDYQLPNLKQRAEDELMRYIPNVGARFKELIALAGEYSLARLANALASKLKHECKEGRFQEIYGECFDELAKPIPEKQAIILEDRLWKKAKVELRGNYALVKTFWESDTSLLKVFASKYATKYPELAIQAFDSGLFPEGLIQEGGE